MAFVWEEGNWGKGVGGVARPGQVKLHFCHKGLSLPHPNQWADIEWSLDREAALEFKSCTWNTSEYECFLVT